MHHAILMCCILKMWHENIVFGWKVFNKKEENMTFTHRGFYEPWRFHTSHLISKYKHEYSQNCRHKVVKVQVNNTKLQSGAFPSQHKKKKMGFGSYKQAVGREWDRLLYTTLPDASCLTRLCRFSFHVASFSLFYQTVTRTHTPPSSLPLTKVRLMVASASDRWRPHSTAHCKLSFNQA